MKHARGIAFMMALSEVNGQRHTAEMYLVELLSLCALPVKRGPLN